MTPRPKFRAPRPRLETDDQMRVGMVLADQDGNEVTITCRTTRVTVVSNGLGGFAHGFVRLRWPFIVKA